MKTTQFTARNTGKFTLLSIFTLGACAMSVNSYAATDNVGSHALVVKPISIKSSSPLVFGLFSVGTESGTVVLDGIRGIRSATGGVELLGLGKVMPGGFDVGGEPSMPYSISLAGSSTSLTHSDGNASMGIAYTHASSRSLPSSGQDKFPVGATLSVNGSQKTGSYKGIISATVEYQ
jgi:hypothetical protein